MIKLLDIFLSHGYNKNILMIGDLMKGFICFILCMSIVYGEYSDYLIEKGSDLYAQTKSQTLHILNPKEKNQEEVKKEHLNEVWRDSFDALSDGTKYIIKLEKAPNSAWFDEDKEDIQKDIDEILDNMIEILIGDELNIYTDKIKKLQKKISSNQKKIVSYREDTLVAPLESYVSTTQEEYKKKITKLKEKNISHGKRIDLVKQALKERFTNIGVILTQEQIDVLLSRVDGNDIVQMALVMDILKHITSQIMVLMKASKEELEEAKKYYAMHLICLELVVYIQQKYIQKVSDIYIPKIDMLIASAKEMIEETKRLKNADNDRQRKTIYTQNLHTQKLTYETSRMYKKDLLASKVRMENAQEKSKADLRLSRNTYKTVMLSSELYRLITQSQYTFAEVSKIHIPNIIPFQNEQMKQKYKELTRMLGEE
jgi:hypothetical protein